ncbi:MAG: DUF4097 family beta strand repeat protein [Candidatus Aminicenantes bacterium]|nr:DUF4097 family beta strand repeat protein [Candidatus Aminicenantes bacterium]
MKIKVFWVLLFLLFSLNYGYKYEKQIKRTFPMDQDGILQLSNVNGFITLSTQNKNEISIKAIKRADRKSDLENVIIKFEFEKKELKVFTKRIKKQSTAKVNFYVKVPKNLKSLKLNSVNGQIEIDGQLRMIKSKTVNGNIHFKGVASDSEFYAINGGVFFIFQERLKGNISAETVNGTVKIELQKDSSFRIKGSTLNGGIKNDFNVAVESKFIGSKITGTINQGQYNIKLKTVNGNIKLLKI